MTRPRVRRVRSPGEQTAGGGRRELQPRQRPRPGCPAVPGRVPLAGRNRRPGTRPADSDWDKIRGEAHLVPSPSVLPLPPALFPRLNPPAFHGGPAGAQWEPKY